MGEARLRPPRSAARGLYLCWKALQTNGAALSVHCSKSMPCQPGNCGCATARSLPAVFPCPRSARAATTVLRAIQPLCSARCALGAMVSMPRSSVRCVGKRSSTCSSSGSRSSSKRAWRYGCRSLTHTPLPLLQAANARRESTDTASLSVTTACRTTGGLRVSRALCDLSPRLG